MESRFDALPRDMFFNIFKFVPAYEYPKLALVCKRWQQVSKDNFLWEYKFDQYFYPNKLKKYYPSTSTWQKKFFKAIKSSYSLINVRSLFFVFIENDIDAIKSTKIQLLDLTHVDFNRNYLLYYASASLADYCYKNIVLPAYKEGQRYPKWELLHWAIACQQSDATISRLLEFYVPNKNIESPLIVASQFGNARALRYLLQKFKDINVRDSHGYTPLLNALKKGHITCAKLLLEKYGDNLTLADTDHPFYPALHLAVRTGDFFLVNRIMQVPNINFTLRKKMGTPLSIAVRFCHVDIVSLLIQAGAAITLPRALINDHNLDANLTDPDLNRTPFAIAAYRGHLEILKFLAPLTKYLDGENNDFGSPLFYAASNGHLACVDYICGLSGVDINRVCPLMYNGWLNKRETQMDFTPLMSAADNGHLEVVIYLLNKGASTKGLSECLLDHISYFNLPITSGNIKAQLEELLQKFKGVKNSDLLISAAFRQLSEQIDNISAGEKKDILVIAKAHPLFLHSNAVVNGLYNLFSSTRNPGWKSAVSTPKQHVL